MGAGIAHEVVVVPKGGRQLVVRIGIAAGRARLYCVRREAVLGRGYVSAVQVNGDIAGCAAEGGYRKTVGVAHDDLTSHARPDGRAGSETVEAHDAGQLAGDDLDIRLTNGKVIGIGCARHRGRSQYGRDVESLGERGTAWADKERRNRPVLSPAITPGHSMRLFAGVAVPPVRSGFTRPRSMVWPFASLVIRKTFVVPT